MYCNSDVSGVVGGGSVLTFKCCEKLLCIFRVCYLVGLKAIHNDIDLNKKCVKSILKHVNSCFISTQTSNNITSSIPT